MHRCFYGLPIAAGLLSLVIALATGAVAVESPNAESAQPAAAVSSSAPSADSAKLEYNRDIRPILSENCFSCHGPDSASRKADLRLDSREAALASDAMTPGKPDESALVRRILSADPKELMPPPDSHKVLTAAQKERIKRWVAEGAEYQLHWSFIAPKRPAEPSVKNAAWPKNAIDRFILAELEKRGLAPAEAADRRTLARRVSLDLTGLPPAPEVVDAFVADKDANAYEKLVDKFLASPQWGEHRTRYWLDAARYADTHGIHFDNYREMWSYRDWLIEAYNRNLPFDQFTLQQLAGDLMPNRTLENQIASGFNRCNMTTNEGGSIAEEYLVLYNRDRTETTSQVWLGLTTGCAVCHDHKFDPLSQKEFYELAAFFNNTTQAAMDGNVRNTPPVVTVAKPEDRAKHEALEASIAEVRKNLDARKAAGKADYDRWLADAKPETFAAVMNNDGLKLHAPLSEGKEGPISIQVDGQARTLDYKSLTWEPGHVAEFALKFSKDYQLEIADVGNVEKDESFAYGGWINIRSSSQAGAVLARMDDSKEYRGWDLWVENAKVGAHIIHKWPGNAIKVLSKKPIAKNAWQHVFVTYDGSGKASGVKLYVNGQIEPTETMSDSLKDTIRTDAPLKFGSRHKDGKLAQGALHDIRVYGKALAAVDVEKLYRFGRASVLAAKPADKRSDAEKKELYEWWLTSFDTEYQAGNTKLAALTAEQTELKGRGTIAHVMQEKPEPAMAYILFRGDYDKRRDKVTPGTPKVLPPMAEDAPRNRLGLAQWLLRDDHPLTARVTVNRMWQELFGTGIVRSAGDFGITGDMPSHPELLDYLAVDFRESGWDVKRFYKQLVMSATYQQASVVTPEKKEKDAQNRYLSRGPRFRMDAEMVRDYALAASGLLTAKIGGPSVRPYQPDGVWEAVAMPGSDTRNYKRDSGENLYRRSMYTFWKRAAPPASMEVLNAPNREQCTVTRERTNTPLQALVTLNDPQFVEAARNLAQKALKTNGDDKVRLDFVARTLLARSLRPEEQEIVLGSLKDLIVHYQSGATEAAALIKVGESHADSSLEVPVLAAWTMLCNELLNLDEVLCK